MTTPASQGTANRRVLVIDDNEAIHADFRKILTPAAGPSDALLAAEAALFGAPAPAPTQHDFVVVTANQGRIGLELAQQAKAAGQPFAVAFVDMRMPPGWDGLETIQRIWAVDPDLEMVICTAFSDYSWDETVRRLGRTDRLLVVKKPFDTIEVLQVANALTEKWNLQRQVRRTLDELDAAVRTRTAELVAANRELAAARDAAEAANRSKSLFLANISHELRTPMTAILGYAEEVHERITDRAGLDFEREALATIQRNAQHLVLIIGDLLDISKLEAGKLQVESIACAPRDVLHDVVDLLLAKARDKGVGLDATVAADVPTVVLSDPLRLRQILVNLTDNAVKFTAAGRVRLHAALDAGARQLVFTVQDQGCGMDAATQQRLFRPFEQADVSTTRRHGGTGLGLAISQQLAGLLGGDITVHSEPGSGSTFTLRIAAGAASAAEAKAITGAAPAAGTTRATPVTAPGVRVLLVEDGADNQRLIAHILRRSGMEVAIAEHGRRGLDLLGAPADHRFDLVLMDIQMPVMDGLEATARLRADGHRLPVVALTASAMVADADACRAAGCDGFLAKPIDRQRLVEMIAAMAKHGAR